MRGLDDIRRRVEVQGFSGLNADDFRTVVPWMRFPAAMNFGLNAIGTVMGSPAVLLGLAALMLVGAILPVHPWDVVYNVFVRRLTATRPLPTSGWRRRLTFALGFVWLCVRA
jgi:hypothetical protein